MFWETTHKDLDAKINRLESKVLASKSIFGFHEWDETFRLTKEIQEDFKKKIRYPTKAERDAAWQKFFNLREDAYRIKREQVEEKSRQHFNELRRMLRFAGYDALGDALFEVFTLGLTFGAFQTTVEDMKWKGKQLREAGQLFKTVKHEMTREHKAEIHEMMVSVRASHDDFWQRYRDYQQERSKIRDEKRQAWEEGKARRAAAKERIRGNIDKNKEKLSKARDALYRFEQRRSDLRDQISSAWSDSFRDRAEGWLSELEDKIADVEQHIDRIESWISEDESKLSGFD